MIMSDKAHCFKMSSINKHVFGTTEWAVANANYLNGCSNDCKYCYSKEMAIRFKRKTVDSWKDEVVNWPAFYRNIRHKDGYIMFPSTHDITPEHLGLALDYILRLLNNDNTVLIVTKPSFQCIEHLCNALGDFKDRILFRFTIGSINSETLRLWEPNAPCYAERKQSLIYAYNAGFKTSISCEPMLDDQVSALINDLSEYVTDAIWLGKMNFLLRRLNANGHLNPQMRNAAEQLLFWQSDSAILSLYEAYKDNPKIKWKESIKKVVGLEISTKKGEDN